MMTAGIGALAVVSKDTPALAAGLSFVGALGVGGIVNPAAIILNIISPDELIATITALTLSIRVVGGVVGYAIYLNIFQSAGPIDGYRNIYLGSIGFGIVAIAACAFLGDIKKYMVNRVAVKLN